jgi:GT2 family glycosyltransferase
MAFCMLMKRDVFNQIKFKEIFDKGCYEDNLFCKELTEKGYSLWISVEADVTHAKPGRSFEANNINYLEIINKNERIYEQQKDKSA